MERQEKRTICNYPEGPAGNYANISAYSGAVQTLLAYSTTLSSTASRTFRTTASTRSSTTTSYVSVTITDTESVVARSQVNVTVADYVTITTSTEQSTTTTSEVPSGTTGPFVLFATTQALTKRDAVPTAGPLARLFRKRQDSSGYIGLAASNGTAGVVADVDDALRFYIIDGQLISTANDTDWYTYTELTTVADGSEIWVFQEEAPSDDSISTAFVGADGGVLDDDNGDVDWVNDVFTPEPTALACREDALVSNPDVPLLRWYYDLTLIPTEFIVSSATASTTTSVTTETATETVTAAPTTTYVCTGGGICPVLCGSDIADLTTSTICTTDTAGSSTCAECLVAPTVIIETAVTLVTSTIECDSPPCPEVVTQVNINTPCDGDETVTVYQGGTQVTVTEGAAATVDSGAGNANVVSAASDTSTDTTSTSFSTRTSSPTASPSVGFASRVGVEAGSAIALVIFAAALSLFA
ncbi:hypothetical protein ABW19_dt0205176 [Dactylella cylindrospora]|nr:hypothetical protein ABW19_dt0205176 [Dactylella cylindrospora]